MLAVLSALCAVVCDFLEIIYNIVCLPSLDFLGVRTENWLCSVCTFEDHSS